MAEQNFPQALRIADRGYVIVHRQIAFEGRSSQELNNNELIKKFYWDSERIYRRVLTAASHQPTMLGATVGQP